ncbi:glycoside hydrolase family 32 protein [Brevibacterium sp.]|uniref:glycoside hydrolase family 32 protein n=1 Tax=Brevibacterium sp. TaxID=1701 RepID=UPI002811EFBC|nr:glycoside hydrolase family 32 protein [Brevibacterium sp.]
MTRLHYSPPRNWVNDPNGLVHHKGRYHLYFQYNPLGVEHDNMSWGHASSPDLLEWDDHPVAIGFDDEEQVFSGSIVVDHENSTGLGTVEEPALIAFYTSHSKTQSLQTQSIAYSLDDGLTWTKYSGNPILDRGSENFRDPKVIRCTGAEETYWVMVAVEAEDRQVVFYRSDDLLHWTHLSTFGPAGAVGGVWECPDLFPLRVEGTDETHWVLLVSLNPGGIAGGSGTQCFLGEFDGRTFTPHTDFPLTQSADDAGMRRLDWVDYGRDCYAGVTFAGLPDEERTLIAWMSNWDYAKQMPVDEGAPQRGSMTLPRRLSLVDVDGRLRLRQVPVAPSVVEGARLEELEVTQKSHLPVAVPDAGRLEFAISLGEACGFEIGLEGEDEARVVLAYDAQAEELSVDRRASAAGLPAEFASAERMPVAAAPVITLTLWLDRRAVEIYAENGTRVLTDLIGSLRSPQLSLAGIGGAVRLESLVVGSVVGT